MSIKWRFLIWKAYFDKGFALTGYIKYALAFFGIFQLITAKTAIIFGFLYAVFCFFLGKIWFTYFINDENEIQNIFNPFQREVREKLIRDSCFER